jgi:hypothetical protein
MVISLSRSDADRLLSMEAEQRFNRAFFLEKCL